MSVHLVELLAGLDDDQLERIANEHSPALGDERMSRAALLELVESNLRSYRFIQEFITNRQPPTFAILTLLLEEEPCGLPTSAFRERVDAETHRLADLIQSGDLLAREDQLRLYRRVLYEARRNDLQIDASEAAILGVLRHELRIAQVEHFLLEHHNELQEFWRAEGAFLTEITALHSIALVFAHEGMTRLAEDTAPLVRQVLGIDMPKRCARRLFSMLQNHELYDALGTAGIKTSGTKEERVERLLLNMIQPRNVLRALSSEALRGMCKDSGAQTSGVKDDFVERLVQQFSLDRDLVKESEPPEAIREPRALGEERFRALFGGLRGDELAEVLEGFPELRQSGTKETRIATLWGGPASEETYLSRLKNADLEAILDRARLRSHGSKPERIARLIEHYSSISSVEPVAPDLADRAGEG